MPGLNVGFGLKISSDTLTHIWKKHWDLVKTLEVRDLEELLEMIMQILEHPDEVYEDRVRSDIRYYIRRIDDFWVNVVLMGDTVKTAYLISLKSYRKFREKRWYRHS